MKTILYIGGTLTASGIDFIDVLTSDAFGAIRTLNVQMDRLGVWFSISSFSSFSFTTYYLLLFILSSPLFIFQQKYLLNKY